MRPRWSRSPGGWLTASLWLLLAVAVVAGLLSSLTAPTASREAPLTVWAPRSP